MRALCIPLVVSGLLAACGDSGPALGDTITIDTPSFVLQPGEEKFYCYYTTLPNTEAIGAHRFTSSMPAGSHHMIVFKTKKAMAPDGTFAECDNFGMGDGGIADVPVWLYASQNPEGELTMPEGVGVAIGASQTVIVNLHYVNTTDAPITAQVHIDIETFAPKQTFIEAHAMITFNTQIDVPPNSMGSAGGSCDVDSEWQFITMSTHSHKYTVNAQVHDGPNMVLETLDWAHATLGRWDSPYLKFSSGKLDYRCTYHNTLSVPLETGESAINNEMCMAVGLYFPANGDTFCLNSLTVTL